jgi:hypothetical protein
MNNPVFLMNACLYLGAALFAGYAILRIVWPYKVLLIFTLLLCGYFSYYYFIGYYGLMSSEAVFTKLREVSSGLPVQLACYIWILLLLLKGHRR